jgi:hypothetical protein
MVPRAPGFGITTGFLEAKIVQLPKEGAELLGSEVFREDVPLDVLSRTHIKAVAIRSPVYRFVVLLEYLPQLY